MKTTQENPEQSHTTYFAYIENEDRFEGFAMQHPGIFMVQPDLNTLAETITKAVEHNEKTEFFASQLEQNVWINKMTSNLKEGQELQYYAIEIQGPEVQEIQEVLVLDTLELVDGDIIQNDKLLLKEEQFKFEQKDGSDWANIITESLIIKVLVNNFTDKTWLEVESIKPLAKDSLC